MGLTDFIRSQFIEIIEWTDDSRDTLSYRFPDEDKEIKHGAQLIVRESQTVQFVYLGQFGDTVRPGQVQPDHRQHPDPLTPQGVEVRLRVAVQGRRLLRCHAAVHRQQVGHVQPGDDARPGLRHRPPARLRHLRLPDRRPEEVPQGSRRARTTTSGSTSSPTRCARASSASSAKRWPTSKVPVLDVADALQRAWRGAAAHHQPDHHGKYGIEMASFVVENVSVPPEVEAAIDKRSSMAAVGNLNDYVKFQMAQGLEKGGSGVGGIGAEMAVGMAIAQQMMNQPGGIAAQTTPAAAPPPATAAPAPSPNCWARPMPRRFSASPSPTSSPASRPAI